MGPITLFDKSFLHSLNLDEAVWFDHFFLSNVCPIFFAETLADLAKPGQEGRSGADEVRFIADKSPQMHGAPCVHHSTLAYNNLLGRRVSMHTRQIPLAGGRRVRVGGELGTVFEQTPEAKAFARWQEGRFEEIERDFARTWREQLAATNLRSAAKVLASAGISDIRCRSLVEARTMATDAIYADDRRADRLRLVLSFLGIRQGLWEPIQRIWSSVGRPPVSQYAPYATYVAEVEVFFTLALAAGLISTERPSNKLDISYLFYLPFAMVFVSGDKLHKRCCNVFTGPDQSFVWAHDLKADLRRINDHFSNLPEDTKELGIMAFAHTPPENLESIVVQLWDKHLPRWREMHRRSSPQPSKKDPQLVARLRRFERAPTLPPNDAAYDDPESDALSIARLISKKRGSWWQLPKDLQEERNVE
jgi:hypothetical protein